MSSESLNGSGASASGSVQNFQNDVSQGSDSGETIPEMVGFDKDNADKLSVVSLRMEPISLKVLEGDDADEEKLNFRYLDLVLLRVINPSSQSGNVAIYKRLKTESQSNVKYTRLFLLKIHSPAIVDQNNRLVYVFVSRTSNLTIWDHNMSNRDNGNVSIGRFLRVVSPSPIVEYMRGEIPVMVTNNPLILLKPPIGYDSCTNE